MTQLTNYDALLKQMAVLLQDETDKLANSANFVALLFAELSDINWLGIYVLREKHLVLGPYQGLPACTRIAIGDGVCGTAAKQTNTIRVSDVHNFPGHIACDANSRSEIVVPLLSRGKLIGVLDVDSPSRERFTERDERGLEQLCRFLVQKLEQETKDLENFI